MPFPLLLLIIIIGTIVAFIVVSDNAYSSRFKRISVCLIANMCLWLFVSLIQDTTVEKVIEYDVIINNINNEELPSRYVIYKKSCCDLRIFDVNELRFPHKQITKVKRIIYDKFYYGIEYSIRDKWEISETFTEMPHAKD
jgi:hypothetical protein